MVDTRGRNAFHVSVESGKANALRSLLRRVRPAELLNRVDAGGDTPLHIAAKRSRVHCALLLLKDRRVDPCVRDRDGETARSLVEVKLRNGRQLKHQEAKRCRKQQLPPLATYPSRRGSNDEYFERIVETYILVATLIATVTFAANVHHARWLRPGHGHRAPRPQHRVQDLRHLQHRRRRLLLHLGVAGPRQVQGRPAPVGPQAHHHRLPRHAHLAHDGGLHHRGVRITVARLRRHRHRREHSGRRRPHAGLLGRDVIFVPF
ncbi:unnamed protein product [Urochloa humidicola]